VARGYGFHDFDPCAGGNPPQHALFQDPFRTLMVGASLLWERLYRNTFSAAVRPPPPVGAPMASGPTLIALRLVSVGLKFADSVRGFDLSSFRG
jgi:hypothetical protein